jgi:FkbM family methyltransferase
MGRNAETREQVVRLCHEIEARMGARDFDVREKVTGPMIDALLRDVGTLEKTLKNGLVFNFKYSGKIARDFVLSSDANPDHIWEPQTTKLLLHLTRNAKAVVIAGAYAGDQALLIAQQMAPHGGVCHCFEPDGEQLALLEKNAIRNKLEKNVSLSDRCLWDQENVRLNMLGQAELGSAQLTNGGGDSATATTTTINAYGASKNLQSIDLLMLDVEGGEPAILRGASNYLSQPAGKAPNIVFEIHRAYVDWSNGLESTEIFKMLRGHGYKLFAVRDYQSNVAMAGQPIELVDTERVYLEGPPHGFNVVAVKDESLLSGALFSRCADVSPKLLRFRDPALHQPLSGPQA